MPTMYEIYENHAENYDALVNHEDYQGNLKSFLDSKIDFNNAVVYEAGTGTGRVTSLYVKQTRNVFCVDRSTHMLDQAKENLKIYSEKIHFIKGDNLELPPPGELIDVFIEGWAFCHTISDNKENLFQVADQLVKQSQCFVKKQGKIVFIETLGTFREIPEGPLEHHNVFYRYLQDKYGFQRNVVNTDYHFDSVERAAQIMGFFFGESMEKRILESKIQIIPEFTGVWIKENS